MRNEICICRPLLKYEQKDHKILPSLGFLDYCTEIVKSLLTELMTCPFLLLVKLQHKRLILVDEAWLNQLFLPLSYPTEPHMLSQVY